MNRIKRISIIFIISVVRLFAQHCESIYDIKQITNFEYECRNPSFNVNIRHSSFPPFFLFEAHKDSSVEIAMSEYDSYNDKFSEPIFIANNGGDNKNPIGVAPSTPYSQQVIIWETNINGNVDLVYREVGYNDTSAGDIHFITKTLANERDFSNVIGEGRISNKFTLVYERKGSIYLYTHQDTAGVEETVFPAMDCGSVYKQPTGIYQYNHNGRKEIVVAVVEENIVSKSSRLIYRFRAETDSMWSDVQTIYDSTNCKNPKFFLSLPRNEFSEGRRETCISFETSIEGATKVMYYNSFDEFGNNTLVHNYYDSGEVTNFSSYIASTGLTWGSAFYSVPNSAKVQRNDSTYILIPKEFSSEYEEIPIKYKESRHKLGNLGNTCRQEVTYVIWEDSSANGKINLFGKGRHEISVGITDKKEESIDFRLSQNYPNPFNPSTTISYTIPASAKGKMANVKLVVYDVLGREVAILVDKAQNAGSYKVVFDASQLNSGVYFYQLQYGVFTESKKLILLK